MIRFINYSGMKNRSANLRCVWQVSSIQILYVLAEMYMWLKQMKSLQFHVKNNSRQIFGNLQINLKRAIQLMCRGELKKGN